MKITARFVAALALAAILCTAGTALAGKQDYASMTTAQLQEAARVERQAYKSVRKQIRRLVNGTANKNTPEYKANYEKLTREAEDRKVTLDSLKETLAERKKGGGAQ